MAQPCRSVGFVSRFVPAHPLPRRGRAGEGGSHANRLARVWLRFRRPPYNHAGWLASSRHLCSSLSAASANSADQSGHTAPLTTVRIGDTSVFALREWRSHAGLLGSFRASFQPTPSPEGGGLGRGGRTPIDLRVCGFVFADPRTTMRVGWLRFVICAPRSLRPPRTPRINPDTLPR
jgi:hypothetical protein